MKKVVLIFGSIAGVISAAMLVITLPYMMEGDMSGGEVWGYSSMIIALSAIFFGIKSYRDKYLGGVIKFGKAFLLGLYISLLASALYALGWEVSMAVHGVSVQEFIDYYTQCQIDMLQKSGASADKIAALETEKAVGSWYLNPFLRFLASMVEIFPVGLLVSLISAAILKKKEVLPASNNN